MFRFHRRVIDPARRGLLLAAARLALQVAAAAYGLGIRARNALYRTGIRKVHRADVPVISVGNITAGGTGKTPLVAWLACLLHIHKVQPAILSRGYGRHEALGVDDENALLARLAGGAPIVVNPDRVEGARTAVREHGAEALVLDDGFQHRRIARDLDIVLIDAVWPFGGGHLIPRGLLREPVGQLRRADFFLLTRANLVTPERRREITDRLAKIAPGVPVASCGLSVNSLRPVGARDDAPLDAARLGDGRWAAFCGIGNPEGFLLTLRRAGCEPALFQAFSDHERYSRRQVERLLDAAEAADCDGVVTTAKDAVKLARLLEHSGRPSVYSLETELDFAEGAAELTAAILKALGRTP